MKTSAIAPVVLAVLVAAGGCGASNRALSRHDFVREANAICGEANEQVRALGPEPPILTDEQADWIEQLTKIDRKATEKLDALQPPDAAKHPIASMLSAFERGLGNESTASTSSASRRRRGRRRGRRPRSRRRSSTRSAPRRRQRSRRALAGRTARAHPPPEAGSRRRHAQPARGSRQRLGRREGGPRGARPLRACARILEPHA